SSFTHLCAMVPSLLAQSPGCGRAHGRARLIRGPHHDLALDADLCSGGLCKLKPMERSVKLRRLSDGELSSSCECRVPQFGHRRIAPPEFARLELPLIFIFLLARFRRSLRPRCRIA